MAEQQEGASFADEIARNAIRNSDNAVDTDDIVDDNIDDSAEDEELDDAAKQAAADATDDSNSDDDNDDSDDDIDEEVINKIKEKEESERTDEENEQLEQFEEQNKPFIYKLRDSYGYEELSEKEYENTQEGFKELNNDISKIQAKTLMETMLEEYPSMQKLYEHTVVNKLPEETFLLEVQKPNYSKFDLKTDEGASEMIRLALSDKDIDEDIVEATIDKYKNEGKLKEKSKSYFDSYEADRQSKIESQNEQSKKQQEAYQLEQDQIAKDTKQLISKGKLRGIELNVNDQKQYVDYLSKVDSESGDPQIVSDFNNLSLEDKHFINYQIFKRFELKGIESKKINKQTLDDIVNQDKSNKNNKRKVNKKVNKGSGAFDIDFERLEVL